MVENAIRYMQSNKVIIKLLCALIIFISGIVIGSGATVMMIKHRVIWVSRTSKDVNDIAAKVTKKYSLTPQQSEQVRIIIDKAFQQKKLRDEYVDKQRDEYAQVIISEMNSVLTPEQFKRWSKDFEEIRNRIKKRK